MPLPNRGRTFMSFGLSPNLLRRLDRQVDRQDARRRLRGGKVRITRAELVRRALAAYLTAIEDDDDRFDDEIMATRAIEARVLRRVS